MYEITVRLAPCEGSPCEYLKRRTEEGLLKLFGENTPDFARKRLEDELEFIKAHYYGKYFYGLDRINRAVRETPGAPHFRIVGAGCEFFVTYLLGITPVNPLKPYYRCKTCGKVTEAGVDGYAEDLPDRKCECGGETVKEGFDICFHEFRKTVGFFTEDTDRAAKILRDIDATVQTRKGFDKREKLAFMNVKVYPVSPKLLNLFELTGVFEFPGEISARTLDRVYRSEVFTSPEKLELLKVAVGKVKKFGDLAFLISAALIHDSTGADYIKRFADGEDTGWVICTREDYKLKFDVTADNYLIHADEIMKLPSKIIAVGLAASIAAEESLSDFDILTATPEETEEYTKYLTAEELLDLAEDYDDSYEIYDALFDRFDELSEDDGKKLVAMARKTFDEVLVDRWLEYACLDDEE